MIKPVSALEIPSTNGVVKRSLAPEDEHEIRSGVLDRPVWELFAQLVATGQSARAAYMRVYDTKDELSADANGSRLMRREDIRGRVKQLQGAVAHGRILSLAQKREYLHDVVTTGAGEVDRKHPLCQSWQEAVSQNGHSASLKMPDKLRAIEIDAKLAGELGVDPEEEKTGKPPISIAMINVITRYVTGAVTPDPKTFEIGP